MSWENIFRLYAQRRPKHSAIKVHGHYLIMEHFLIRHANVYIIRHHLMSKGQ